MTDKESKDSRDNETCVYYPSRGKQSELHTTEGAFRINKKSAEHKRGVQEQKRTSTPKPRRKHDQTRKLNKSQINTK